MNKKSTLWGLEIPQSRKALVVFLFVVFFSLVLATSIVVGTVDCLPVELYCDIFGFKGQSMWRYYPDYPVLLKSSNSMFNLFFSRPLYYFTFFLMLLIAGFVFAFIIIVTSEDSILESIEELNKIELKKQEEQEQAQHQKLMEIQSFEQKISDLEEKFGKATTKICLSLFSRDKLNLEKYFIVFGDKSVLFTNNTVIQFKDILSYSLSDNKKIVQTAQTITTSKTGSVVGRGIVGGIVAGPAGIIVGGATASKDSKTTYNSPITTHNYTIYITVNNLNNPMIEIPIGNNENNARQISSLLEVIINNNQMNYGK